MHKNNNFPQSFKCALSGVISAVRNEKNFRFHIWAATVVTIFAYNFGLSKTEWLILIMTVALVLICELVNTAVENAADTATSDYSVTAKAAKDTAAGAVLLSAVSAVFVGVILFFDAEKMTAAFRRIFTSIPNTVVFAAAVLLGGIFAVFGKEKKEKKK